MKKIFTLMAAALLGMSAYAQEMEEDVTSYIKNAGFDEDVTWNADGSTKEIVDKSENLSNRSQAWVAADNSVYCSTLISGNGNWKRTDTDFSWNGFIGQVSGWTLESNKSTSAPYKASSPEWVYFGTLPYDLGPTAVPIADDNNGSFLRVPATKPEGDNGDDNKAAVYLRAGWGGSAAYKQVVDLPCAQYRLDYWVYNDNYNNSKGNTKVKNLCKVTCRKDVFEDSLGFAAQTWEKHSIEFTPTANFTIQFGFTSDGSSNNNPFLFIDGIRLYKIGEADAEELLKADLSEYIDSLNYLIETEFADYEGFANELSDKAMEYQSALDNNDQEEMKAAMLSIQAYLGEVNGYLASIEAFKALLSEAEMLITKTEANPYPGIDAFMEKFDACNDYIDGGFTPEGDLTAAEFLAQQTEALKQAINDYKFSQEATPDNPADYTFLIQNPEFITAEAEPTYDELGNATYPNVDSYSAGSAPADAVSTGWYIGEGGGDQRLNYVQGRVCWNAWRSDAIAPISISQDLEGLPNGVYSVSAYMITQAGYITDQHVFANGTIQSGNSPVLSKDTWNDDNTGDWDFLTTEKVIVSDGKLTIGALGNLSGEAAAGWFCVTHFVLNYYGKATEEDVVKLYNDRINDFTAYAEGMGFKADKKAFEEVVKANSGLTDYNEIQSALATLNDAYATAQKSQSEYDGVLAGTYNDLKTNIAETYPEQTKLVAQKIVDIETQYLESDTASYVYSTLKTPILRYYRDNLLPVLQECEGRIYEDESAQKAMAETIQSVVDALLAITDFPTTDELAVYVEKLNEALSVCDAAERIHKNGINAGDDYTFAIAHPTVDDSNATGWTVTRTNGDANAKTGQEYDGGSGYYMDSWNPTAGLLLYTAQQTVTNIPNGTYEVKAMVRTSSDEGYYLFGNDGAEATPKFAHVTRESFNYTKYMDPLAVAEAGGDSIAFVTDQHGSIWEAAMDELMAATGINKPITLDDGTPYSIAEQISEKYAADVTEVPEELQHDFLVMSANSNLGRGWQYKAIQIDVTNHAITFGVTTDSTFTAGYKDLDGVDCAPFTGTWVSADNFTLTLLTPGDNTGWSPVYTEIEELKAVEERVLSGLFNIAGQRVGNDYKGIVITGGKKMLKK